MQLEVDQYDADDPEEATFAKDLPDGRIILVRDVHKALDGQDFRVYPAGGGLPDIVRGTLPEDVAKALSLFRRFKLFGLPHGRGWMHELPWVVDVLQSLSETYDMIDAWRIRNAQPAGDQQGANPGAWEDG